MNYVSGITIPDVPQSECIEYFGQIQKVLLQRTYYGGNVNGFDYSTIINDPDSWQDKLNVNDGSKIVISPELNNPVFEVGEAQKVKRMLGGVDDIIGPGYSRFTVELHGLTSQAEYALKQIRAEKLSIYFINESGQIGGVIDSNSVPSFFQGASIWGMNVSDRIIGGYDSPDINRLTFYLPGKWSDRFFVLNTDFDTSDLPAPGFGATFDSTLITFDSTIYTFDDL